MILRVLHNLSTFSRQTNILHSGMFALFLPDSTNGISVEYVNPLLTRHDSERHTKADLTVVTYELLSLRSLVDWFEVEGRLRAYLTNSERNIAFVQDDYTGSGFLEEFLLRNRFAAVYTPLQNDLDKIYPKFQQTARLEHAMTGYFDDRPSALDALDFTNPSNRAFDFFSRVRRLPRYFGRHGQRKSELSRSLARFLLERGASVDFSDLDSDAITGKAWGEKLSNAKTTFAALGGASEVDRWNSTANNYGLLKRAGVPDGWAYALSKPMRPIQGDFSAVSPRVFEAVARGTVMISPPSDTLHGFIPWEHFLPWEGHENTVDEVMSAIRDSDRLAQIAGAARDLVRNGNDYGYTSFVRSFLKRELPTGSPNPDSVAHSLALEDPVVARSKGFHKNPGLFYQRITAQTGVTPSWDKISEFRTALAGPNGGSSPPPFINGLLSGEVSYLSVGGRSVSAGIALGL